ncbi:MAG: adaptor protein MecA [Lachnospiraceae bacterium]|nr:adaptor protein MecA [Lachnospiraceae bacterium]
MTFKRINEDTICCILSENDMLDYGVELEDFLMNKEKIQGVLHNVVERAVEELGLEMQRGLLSLQIMPLPDKSISILFSEKGQTNVMDFINQMKKLIANLNEGKDAEADALPETQKAGAKKGKPSKKAKDTDKQESGLRIYEFASLNAVADFCTYIPTKSKVASRLYKNPKTDTFFLVFDKSKLSKKDFAAVCSRAVEFGTYISDEPIRAAYIEEHMEHILEEKAVKTLRKYARTK